ncbi:hypothetical protein ACFONA_07055 [Sphingomonas hylomeconis]|uniref:TonB-dependent receptor n=2 Tax=Sphingomonas hylomeconis TaxID=1395958 RepID=A0ABV7SSI3_9SPHN
MRRPRSLRFAAPAVLMALASVAGVSTSAFAQSAAAPSGTIRLSDEERNAILDSNTVESAAAARGERESTPAAGRAIHGEVGVMIGSNGARGAYGVAEVPLGESADMIVSFESTRYGNRRR